MNPRWGPEDDRWLIAMRREGLERKIIARVMERTPQAVKARLERVA